MKTQINQIVTVIGFFSMSLTTTLAISWGMTGLIETPKNKDKCLIETTKVHHVSANSSTGSSYNLNKTFKFLLPKTLLKVKR